MHLHLSDAPHIEACGGLAWPLAVRDAALLAWLAIEGPTSRAHLGTLLWPASAEAQARTTLRQRLFQLKKQLGRDVALGSPVLQLAEGVAHDLADATELLGDLQLPDAPELDAWLQRQREQRRARERDAVRAQAQALEAAGDLAAALPVARALLRLDPLSEAVHQTLMRLNYLLGDRAAALAAFDACEQVLKHELGSRPSAATLALLATIEMPGMAAPPGAARVLPAAVQRPPRLVGRQAELAALQQAWSGAQVAALVAEAGMGKSRLLAEFAQGRPGIVRAAGRPGDAGVPFATLSRLLRALGERGAAVESAETQGGPARVLAEPGFIGAFGSSSQPGQGLAIQRAAAACLHAAPRLQGVLLDDLHFADAATLELLQALITDDEAPALRWALAFRPADAGTPLLALQQLLTEAALLRPVPLAPLGLATLADLVDQLGLGISGAAIAPQLLQRTGGNPLFVLETLKAAWLQNDNALLEDGAALPRPMSVERLIDQRIAQLSVPALALARVAGIAGVDFSIGLAEAVLGVKAMQLADALAELEAAGVLRGTMFAHDLVFDAVQRSVPQAIAQHTHAGVALWLEQHPGEPARVARHWVLAMQPARALPWFEKAEQRARQALRGTELLAFLDEHADIQEALGQRGAAFETRREARQVHSDFDRNAEGGDQRCDALERLADSPAQKVVVWMERASMAGRRAEHVQAQIWARRALDAAQQCGDSALVRKSQIVLFEVLTTADQTVEALALGEACLGWIDSLDDEEWRRNFHGAMAVLYDNSGQPAKCRAQNELARRIVERTCDFGNLSSIVGNLAISAGETGRLGEAVALGLESLRLAASQPDEPAGLAYTYLNLIEPHTMLGRYREALRWADEAERTLPTVAPGGVPLAQMHRALCYWMLGQRARAASLVAQVAALPELNAPTQARLHLMSCRLSRERGESTQPHVAAGLAFLQGGTRHSLRQRLVIEEALNLPEPAALAALAEVAAQARERGYLGHTLEAQMRSAQLATSLDPAAAREHALQAVALAEEVDLISSYRAELWLHAARALLAAGETRAGRRVLATGVAWVQGTAREHVPAEFVDSFLHRNPVNVELLALAARHGVAVAG